jgi:ribosome-associated protein
MTNPAPIDDVPIGGEVIRLGQFLKFAGLLDSGGNVKEAIIDGYVAVNGEVDRRRGRQLQLGDIVTFDGRSVRVVRESTEPDGDMDHQAQNR